MEPHRDPATGLPTRALLREHVQVACARARRRDSRIALLHVGIDGLRLVGDSLGDEASDAVFHTIAQRVAGALDESDLLAIVGPGELALLVTDLGPDAERTAETVAGQIIVAVRGPFEAGGYEFDLAASVGVSVLPGDAPDPEAVHRHARAAMHQARDARGEQVVFYAGGTADALERLLLTARLRRAIEQGEFVLHYQPIYDLGDGSVAALEALIRWEDPDRGLIPPLDFLPAAEHSGLIEPIGDWVVDALCEQLVAWRDQGISTPVTFNVSLRQFRVPGFAQRLGTRLREHRLDPSGLTVEITESTAMRDPGCVEPVLEELRAIGVRIAIDDFGTGYSSLGRLREMTVDTLKIDRAFLQGAPGDDRAARLVEAALGLVGALGLQAIAEGVETQPQLDFLTGCGCSHAQGFHLARPQTADAVTALL